jgi:hypothetical protein
MGHPLSTQRSGWMGILDLELHNKCLLAKWKVKLLNTDGIWQDLL